MNELTIGQCEGKCDMCDIDCHLRGITEQNPTHLDIATDRLIDRIIREEHGDQ
jgi:hypothetical protein